MTVSLDLSLSSLCLDPAKVLLRRSYYGAPWDGICKLPDHNNFCKKLRVNLSWINEHKNVSHKATWENKTNGMVEKHLVRTRFTDLKRREASDLEQRKIKLSAMLRTEESSYEQEFEANLETPEQVREKMFERMNYLKDKREVERQDEVSRRMDQKFKGTTDELRQED